MLFEIILFSVPIKNVIVPVSKHLICTMSCLASLIVALAVLIMLQEMNTKYTSKYFVIVLRALYLVYRFKNKTFYIYINIERYLELKAKSIANFSQYLTESSRLLQTNVKLTHIYNYTCMTILYLLFVGLFIILSVQE